VARTIVTAIATDALARFLAVLFPMVTCDEAETDWISLGCGSELSA
jgi:hypothetical protein